MQEPPSPPPVTSPIETPAAADLVEVTIPLRSAFLATVRTMTTAMAADAGFSVDEIDDVRLALGEVVTAYLDASAGDDRVAVTYVLGDAAFTMTVRPERGAAAVEFDGLASGILAAVVDEWHVDDDGVTLVKRASEVLVGADPHR
jgi:serine/threonine-protein kinase RsbW